ncbi:DUF2946 domain-containing protein [Aquabacterium lacunae]|uniref:DUF2946 domain-containing protein n=1 Tax=Aquabacterium lacunae TaxID=2528630 RepID=A0A4Q9H404_9BURK|nr:DUF2946 family protein [Aquabacterium lacunae]TBO31102.1 DUF2946 domain-containing protein [Aquabacterium lacunae]
MASPPLNARTHTGAPPWASRPSVWAVLCLAVVLLWAQMGGWLHGLSHSRGHLHPVAPATAHPTEHPTEHPVGLVAHSVHAGHTHHHAHGDATQAHAEQVCETCLAFAALGGTAPLPGLGEPEWAGLSHAAPGPRTGLQAWPTAFQAYRTRAPPG